MEKLIEDTGAPINSRTQSFVQQIIGTFLASLASNPGFEVIAARLEKEVVVDGNTTEAAIRRALFGVDAS